MFDMVNKLFVEVKEGEVLLIEMLFEEKDEEGGDTWRRSRGE